MAGKSLFEDLGAETEFFISYVWGSLVRDSTPLKDSRNTFQQSRTSQSLILQPIQITTNYFK
jgi:hypothetical protein